MIKAILSYVSKLLAALVPFLAPRIWQFSFAEKLGLLTNGQPKPWAEAGIQASLSTIALTGIFMADILELWIPRDDARKFGENYFDALVVKTFRDDLQKANAGVTLGEDLRINVMFIARPWRFCLLMRSFRWYANAGFDPTAGGRHHDAHLWLARWQGLCGQAFTQEKILYVDLRSPPPLAWWRRWFCINEFRMHDVQLKRTAHVLSIVSVPIFKQRGPRTNPRWAAVGVVNIDAVTQKGADWLMGNTQQVGRFFSEHGKVLAYLG